MTKFCTLLLAIVLAGVAGCAAPNQHAAKTARPAPGLYLSYYKYVPQYGVDTAVIGPVTTGISQLYYNFSDINTPRVFDQIIREDAASVVVQFTYGDSSLAPETFEFSKATPTRAMIGGLEITGNYRK
jgi:hypothetical protein